MEEDIALVWYDSEIDECVTETERKLLSYEKLSFRCILCTNLHLCINHIESIPKSNIYFITSTLCARDILPLIHQMRQIDSVFLTSTSNECFEDLLSNYSKIIACFYDTKTLTESIKENIELAQKQKTAFSFFNQHKKPTRELSKESALFLWFQLFKNVLVNMPDNDINARQDLVEFLQQRYHNNNKQMKLIKEFQETYKSHDAIRWYTGQPFLYRHVNKALRTEDIEQLYIFRFFISDLCKSLLREFQILKEYEPRVTLYRGTRIPTNECQKLKENEKHLISMNGFLSTSLSKDVALTFAGTSNETNQSVLFEIECDLSQVQTIVLAQIVEFSANKSEDEVLIDIGAVFRIISVEPKENVVLIKLKATDEGTKIANSYLEINQAELKEKNVRIIWGDLLSNMGYYDKALQYFQKIKALDSTIEDWQLQLHIGHVLLEKGLYDDAGAQYLYANELWEKQESTENISILSHISRILLIKGHYNEVLRILSRNLEIYENLTTLDHDKIYYHDVAGMLSGIGQCYVHKGEYDRAITYFNWAYDTREMSYSCDHFESAYDLDQLGKIYKTKGDYKRALHYFSHASAIYERAFPPNHPNLISLLVNIGQTFGEQNKKEDALKYLKQAFAFHQRISSDTQVDIAFNLDLLACTAHLEGDSEKALALTQRALEVRRTYLGEDHPHIANDLTTLGNILKEQERYDEAHVNYTQAAAIYEKINPDGHPEAAIILHGIGFIYQANGDCQTALFYYRKAQTIYQRHFFPGNSNFMRLLLCIAEVHQLKGELVLAIEILEDCLTTIQKCCPLDDPLLPKTYMMLADTYMLQDNVMEALHAYAKGFSVDVDDEIEHFVYHIGYRLLMLSCTSESTGKILWARNMQKNASIIFQKYDCHNFFSLVEGWLNLRDNDNNNDETSSSLRELHAKASVRAPDISEMLQKSGESELYSSEERYTVDRIMYYYDSMYLYQKVLMDKEERAAVATLLACSYEKRQQYELARHYYEKARTFYRQLITDTNATIDIDELKTTIDDISARIVYLAIRSAARTFFFLWSV